MLYINSIFLWFGAAISIAEIFTGTFFAPLGLKNGIIIIISGHLIGCTLMYLIGLISSKTNLTTMKSTSRSFGKRGSLFFASVNGIQLIGWTAIMIYSGAIAANLLFNKISVTTFSFLISALIICWLIIKYKELTIISSIIIFLLFLLTLLVSKKIFDLNYTTEIKSSISLFSALELSIAMPLSWLPLIGDYTTTKKSNHKIPLISALTYFLASSWMYIIGLFCALYTKENDFAIILSKLGMGSIGLILIILSTVTTTFLDAFSCGVSFSIFNINGKKVSIISVIIGLIIALFWNQGTLESFLYLISSIFIPMAAIQITDYFLIKKDVSNSIYDKANYVIFIIGFIVYRYLLYIDFFLGISISTMIITSLLVILYNSINKKGLKNVQK